MLYLWSCNFILLLMSISLGRTLENKTSNVAEHLLYCDLLLRSLGWGCRPDVGGLRMVFMCRPSSLWVYNLQLEPTAPTRIPQHQSQTKCLYTRADGINSPCRSASMPQPGGMPPCQSQTAQPVKLHICKLYSIFW